MGVGFTQWIELHTKLHHINYFVATIFEKECPLSMFLVSQQNLPSSIFCHIMHLTALLEIMAGESSNHLWH